MAPHSEEDSEPSVRSPAEDPFLTRKDLEHTHREDLIAILVLFLIPSILFADLLFFGVQVYYGDLAPFYHPISKIVREMVTSGEFPVWNPLWSAGQPLAANPNFYVFYPPRWLVLLPDFELGFRLHLLVHVYLALGGAYFLFRDLRLRIPAACFGALTFGLGGFYLSFLKLPPIYFSLVWIPLIFAFTRRLILRPSGRAFAAAALAWGVQLLAGEPTTIIQTGFLLGCFALYESWKSDGERIKRAARNLALVGMLAGAAFLVGAVQMIPTAGLSGDSVRARGLKWDVVRTWSMPPVRPLELVYPDILGDSQLQWNRNVYDGKGWGYIDSFHLGGMAALLIIGGFLYRKPPAGVVALITFLSFLLAAGSHTPILRFLYDHGVMRATRYPEKFATAGVLALTLLATLFADRCLRREPGAIRSMLVASAGVAILSALLALLSFASFYSGMFSWLWGEAPSYIEEVIVAATRQDWLIATLSASVVSGLFYWLDKHEAGPGWVALALTLLVVDLGIAANGNVQRVPEEFFEPPILSHSLAKSEPFRIFHPAALGEKTLQASWTLSSEAKSWINRNGLYPQLFIFMGLSFSP